MSDEFNTPMTTPPVTTPSHRIGPYKLLQRLGEGGMGTVWQAEQTEPVRRIVAVKLVKAGMDSAQVLARFEAERQALALMDHPNIARVLDAGTTPDGQPYFIMELVKGLPITKYCDDARLTVRERLELFIPVCQAVQHAHQKGIIHRDLKPSNVLVALYDGKPVPKVIDFGVAKALHQRLTDRTMFTEVGMMVGTPEYMAPEQAEVNALDIDTRADIYSLGVLLYELLTGARPFDRRQLQKGMLEELLRLIREVEPLTPSKRLTSVDTPADAAARRGTDPKQLSKLVRGDLDWIVMKCLEKERHRRYETANGLAMDVERYLREEPVLAGSPSKAYRLKRFVRRNKGPVLAAGAMAVLLVGGIVGTSWGMVNAQRAREQALRSLGQLEKGNVILAEVIKDLDPGAEKRGGDSLQVQLGQRLAHAAAQLEGDAVGDPLIVARLQKILGNCLRELGHYDQALKLFEQARQTRRSILGAEHPDTLMTLNDLALAYRGIGELTRAVELLEEVREAFMRNFGKDHPETLNVLNNLASTYQLTGQLPQAINLLEQVRDAYVQNHGAGDLKTIGALNNLAVAYGAAGQLPKAIEMLEEVYAARVRGLGPDHFNTLHALCNLAGAYQAAKQVQRAIALYERARNPLVHEVGPNHPETLNMLNNLAVAYHDDGQLVRAIELYKHVHVARVKKLGVNHPDVLHTLVNLASAYQDSGEPEQALPLFQQAAEELEKQEFKHWNAGRTVSKLSSCHEELKQYAEAEVWRRKWVAVVIGRHGVSSSEYATALSALGWNLLNQRKASDAESVLRESLVLREKLEPAAWTTFKVKSLLGGAYLLLKKYPEAEALLIQGYEGMKRRASKLSRGNRVWLTEAAERLVQLYDEWDKPDEATKWFNELESLARPQAKPANPPVEGASEKKP